VKPCGDPNNPRCATRDRAITCAASTAIGEDDRGGRIESVFRDARAAGERGAEDGRDGADGDARGEDDDDGGGAEARKRGETTRGDAGTRERERGG
jgi:hypothetical protein